MSSAPSQPHIAPASKWEVYEGNVQAYRSLSLSSQALYLAIGAILLDGGSVPLVFMWVVAMVTAWIIFFPVIFSRTAIADYYKYDLASFVNSGGGRLDLTDSSAAEPLSERAYARSLNRGLRKEVYATVGAHLGGFDDFRTMRVTRLKLDLLVPLLVSLVWVVFVVYAFLD